MPTKQKQKHTYQKNHSVYTKFQTKITKDEILKNKDPYPISYKLQQQMTNPQAVILFFIYFCKTRI